MTQELWRLIASICVLFFGPLLVRLARSLPATIALLDGFTFVAIGFLVLFDVIPESIHLAGWVALPVAVAGLFGPHLLERLRGRLGAQAHAAALYLALAGLMVHGAIDGIALVAPLGKEHAALETLSVAVILHRLPVGLTIWWLVRPRFGSTAAAAVLSAMALATVMGYALGEVLVGSLALSWLGLFEALVAGSLLHVVLHSTSPAAGSARRWNAAAGAGAVLGAALLAVFFETHGVPAAGSHAAGPGIGGFFLRLALISAPALLIGYVTAGLVHAFLPKASVAWMRRGTTFGQSFRGLAFGLPLPICSCGVVPVYRSLVLQGVPLAAATTLLVAAPELGIESVVLSAQLLDIPFTLVRLAGAALLAVAIGWWIGRAFRHLESSTLPTDPPPALAAASTQGEAFVARLRRGLAVGLGEVVDHTGPWILFGLLIAAIAEPLLSRTGWLTAIPPWLQVPLLALVGMPSYVCASGATPIVAVLILNGLSPGAGLAFLLTGPATNVTTFGILSRLHGRRLALTFGAGMTLLSLLLGWAVNFVLPVVHPDVDQSTHAAMPWIQWTCLAVLAVVFLLSVFRQGPRRFVGEVLSSPDAGAHDDGHSCCTPAEGAVTDGGCTTSR